MICAQTHRKEEDALKARVVRRRGEVFISPVLHRTHVKASEWKTSGVAAGCCYWHSAAVALRVIFIDGYLTRLSWLRKPPESSERPDRW